MQTFLRPSHLVIAAMLGVACWPGARAGTEEGKSIVPHGDLTDRVFPDPRLCLDLDAPAELFFRDVPVQDPIQSGSEALSLLPQSHGDAAKKNGTIQRTMRELLDEPSRNILTSDAERFFSSTREPDPDIKPPEKHFRVDGVIVYAKTSGDPKSNDSMTVRLRRAASLESSKDRIGLPAIDCPSID